MVRTRTGLLVAVAALSLGVTACKSDKKAGGSAGGTATTTNKDGQKVIAGPVGDDLSLLPADSDIVVGLNFAQLQQSKLWKEFSPKFMEQAAAGLNDFKTACGFDPMEAIKSVAAGMKVQGEDSADGIVVVHGPAKDKVTACLPKAKEEAAKKGGDVVIDGDVFIVTSSKGDKSAWTFTTPDTLVGSIGNNASKDALLLAAKGSSALKSSATFVDMFAKVNTKDSLYLLINGNAPFMTKAMASSPVKVSLKAIYGSVNVTDGLTVDMRARLGSADEAANIVNMAKSQVGNPQVKAMFDKLDFSQDGADARVSIALSNQKLQQLIGLFGGMMGGMMGGMGGGGMGGP